MCHLGPGRVTVCLTRGSKAFMAQVRVVMASSFPPKPLKALLEFRLSTQYSIINMA